MQDQAKRFANRMGNGPTNFVSFLQRRGSVFYASILLRDAVKFSTEVDCSSVLSDRPFPLKLET